MNDFLLVLFYRAIVAVNTAVILSGIIWLAKRKEEKDGRKPPTTGNFGITEDPVKELGRVMARIGVSCDTIAEVLNGLSDAVRKREEPSVTPKQTTTGKIVVKPKKRKYDEYSALPYAVDTVQRFYKPILTSAIVQAEDGKIIIPTEETGAPVSGYGDGKIYGYVQTLVPDDGNDDGKAYSINPRTGEVEGYPAIDGTVYRVYFWTSGKAVQAVHVRPQSGREKFEAAFEALKDAPITVYKDAPITVYNLAEESAERYETDFINAKCGDCKHYANSLDGGYCVLRRCPVKAHEKRQCRLFEKYKAPVRTTHICKNCKHYLVTEEGAATGLCGMKDEIAFGNSFHACFEKREGKDRE